MGRKLADIEIEIKSRSSDFVVYLQDVLPVEVHNLLEQLKSLTNVYLFSGLTRNFFLSNRQEKPRDVDFIIEDDLDIKFLFPEYTISKNSFGGFKVHLNDLSIDIWVIKNTWGLNYGQLKLSFSHLDDLPNTTFFNFASILFSLNKNEFIVGKPFLNFLKFKKIDVVLEANPLPSLCIVNSFYYSEKYNLGMSKKLKLFIKNNYEFCYNDFENVQIKHFGEVLFSKSLLLEKIKELS